MFCPPLGADDSAMVTARLTDDSFHELGILKLASPCSESWELMRGDERVRRCDRCRLDVYNLESLTTDEARALLRRREPGRVCARFYRRFDGTVLTRDCPKGFRWGWLHARRLLPGSAWLMVALALVLAAIFGVVALFSDNVRRLEAMSGSMTLQGDNRY